MSIIQTTSQNNFEEVKENIMKFQQNGLNNMYLETLNEKSYNKSIFIIKLVFFSMKKI